MAAKDMAGKLAKHAHGGGSTPKVANIQDRAASLSDRLDLYRAERDTLDTLRQTAVEAEAETAPDAEEILATVVRDFQRVLLAARNFTSNLPSLAIL